MGKQAQQIIVFYVALAMRLPFLFAGYGVEEDSWGHVLNAAQIFENGQYEISRLPGHPLLEALLFILWKVHSPLVFNLFSALAGAGATAIFFRLLHNENLKLVFWWSLAFSAVPVFYITSTYTIDYTMALFFALLSYEALHEQKIERAGIWLAVATGFRLTALGFLLPFAYLILKNKEAEKSKALRIRQVAKLAVISTFVSVIFYLPPIIEHGVAFFNFHRPPYPDFLQIMYKMLIGPWGLIGLAGLALAVLYLMPKKGVIRFSNKGFVFLFLVYLVYAIAYFRMPEKAAFWLPVIPFTLLFVARYLPLLHSRVLIICLLASPFLMGINKADPHTGSKYSPMAVTFDSSDGQLFLDPIQGPIFNDFTKRENKIEACQKIEHSMMLLRQPTVIIAGWWYAMIEVDRRDGQWSNANVKTVYYASPKELEHWKEQGYDLRYLPGQEQVNDKKYNTDYTVTNATLLPI